MFNSKKDRNFYKTISSFNDIPIKKNTLVLCDLDETLWKYDIPINFWQEQFKNHFSTVNHTEKAESLTLENWTDEVKNKVPQHTDKEGFNNMLDRIAKTNSDLVFVTARTREMEDFTVEHLRHLNLMFSFIPVHYVGTNQSKGEYILENIGVINYDHVVFIDDNLKNLQSVFKIFWDKIMCFKFEMN